MWCRIFPITFFYPFKIFPLIMLIFINIESMPMEFPLKDITNIDIFSLILSIRFKIMNNLCKLNLLPFKIPNIGSITENQFLCQPIIRNKLFFVNPQKVVIIIDVKTWQHFP